MVNLCSLDMQEIFSIELIYASLLILGEGTAVSGCWLCGKDDTVCLRNYQDVNITLDLIIFIIYIIFNKR